MTQLLWDQVGDRLYETGVDQGVLFVGTDSGVAWNGLVSVTESPTGGESTDQYSNNRIYAKTVSGEELGGTIEAFTFPEKFEICDGTAALDSGVYVRQQDRVPFALSYRTRLGNDIDGLDHGYKIHIVYNAYASPSEDEYDTINDSPDPLTFSWEFSATPIEAGHGLKPTAYISIDSTKASPSVLEQVEQILYGTPTSDPRLLTPRDLINLFVNSKEMVFNTNGEWYDLLPAGLSDLLLSDTEGEYRITTNSRLAPLGDGYFTLGT